MAGKAGRPKRPDLHDLPKSHFGRTSKKLDWDRVDELLIYGCDGSEIAAVFDMHPHTFYDKVKDIKGIPFTDYQANKRREGFTILKEAQFRKALGTNRNADSTMLIWLGKNCLGQKDSSQVEVAGETLAQFDAVMQKFTQGQQEKKESPF